MGLELEPFDAADYLTDSESIAIYLTDALESGNPEEFTAALADVARARGGVARISETTGLSLEMLEATLSRTEIPDLRTVLQLLRAFGLRLTSTGENNAALAA